MAASAPHWHGYGPGCSRLFDFFLPSRAFGLEMPGDALTNGRCSLNHYLCPSRCRPSHGKRRPCSPACRSPQLAAKTKAHVLTYVPAVAAGEQGPAMETCVRVSVIVGVVAAGEQGPAMETSGGKVLCPSPYQSRQASRGRLWKLHPPSFLLGTGRRGRRAGAGYGNEESATNGSFNHVAAGEQGPAMETTSLPTMPCLRGGRGRRAGAGYGNSRREHCHPAHEVAAGEQGPAMETKAITEIPYIHGRGRRAGAGYGNLDQISCCDPTVAVAAGEQGPAMETRRCG